MIEWGVDDRVLRVTDADNTTVSVHGADLDIEESAPDIPRPVEETLTVTTDKLRFPHAVVYAFSLDSSERYELEPRGAPLSLPAGEYIVDIDTEIKTYLQFSGTATLEKTDDYESVVVSFPDRYRVTVGFRSHHELPAETITVTDSPDAVATAISHLATAHKTDSPDRTYPTLRGHPPLLERGNALEIPDRLRAARSDAGIEVVVPPTYDALFVAAPLAYYLQATLRTAATPEGGLARPRLRLTDLGIEERLSPMPDLERDVERLLRKTFFLDCLVRNAGPYGTNLAEQRVLETLDLDADVLYNASPQQRLATYLEVPYEAIEHRLPEWHLSTYVAPEYDTVEQLPFLLDRLSMLYMPRTSKLEGKELIERSLADFYRDGNGGGSSHDRASASKVASVDIVKPELRTGRAHGWLADGVPIDVFKTTPEAYYNRLDYLERPTESTSVCVVLNDPEMAGEHDEVAEIYRQRAEELSMDVTVADSLSTAELARVFEHEYEFVHYIGHCENGGLRCPDGPLSTSSIDRCNVQTFFLNACGSYYEGIELIEKGSVAGAVTFTKVLNDHAVKVGSTFAKLLVNGYSLERALGLARSRIMMGKDYAVVGDGTHSLVQSDHRLPITITVEDLEDGTGRYLVTLDCYSTRVTGSYYFPHTEANEFAYLCGTESSFTLEASGVASLLRETDASVIYDGDLYWSETLAQQFAR
ncbi:hypothetical protein [Natronorubrum aibiense]|uniref:CHAT domain-containing protein n=1 Tax=Natronorubrum aibiense TaxID=348826 RepID=A0A5P9P691_9EURY|nr:hypothetical protein [Natronorubrum aibiense]QFU83606.1 hypothetical protein GCU68_14175 [Natronorubrum aibiense]